jgi:hypothetical protein
MRFRDRRDANRPEMIISSLITAAIARQAFTLR